MLRVIERTTRGTVFSVVNYDVYQFSENASGPPYPQSDGPRVDREWTKNKELRTEEIPQTTKSALAKSSTAGAVANERQPGWRDVN